ncbi:MAG: VWA domain-containing protein [Ahrensia sp.]|nr:VWA domain-containing protein [Ahrensia sp.]
MPSANNKHEADIDIHPIWADALLAADILALDGAKIAGIEVKAGAGPVRDIWLSYLETISSVKLKRITPDIPIQRLIGGVDMAATLATGKPVKQRGLFDDNPLLVLAMAERCEGGTAATIANGLDGSQTRLIALNEAASDDEDLPSALKDRLDMTIYLDGLSYRQAPLLTPRAVWPDAAAIEAVIIDEKMQEALVMAAVQTGKPSMRKALSLMRVARIIAALKYVPKVDSDCAATAIRLVCASVVSAQTQPQEQKTEQTPQEPDETNAPAPPPPHEKPHNDNEKQDQEDNEDQNEFDPNQLLNMMIEAAKAERPDLAALAKPLIEKTRTASSAGKSGATQNRARRGKPIGFTTKAPFQDARPDVLATLRAAAPFQTLRRKGQGESPWKPGEKLAIRTCDFRYQKLRMRTESVAIFAVDASGSTALERLAEAKGAIELLLADCYVRRDAVALIAFRGQKAELVLEPTRSLVRAKRALSGLPAGGPTPLASALTMSIELASQVRRKGQSALLIFLTDGKGNVDLSGEANRQVANEETERLARQAAILGLKSVVIDIARRPRDTGRQLAAALHGDYCLLPRADSSAVSKIVTQYLTAK